MSRSSRSRFILSCWAVLAGTVLVAQPAAAQKRVALVIGNSAYAHAGALANPANDAQAIATALQDQGFEVLLGLDLDKRGFDGKVRDFSRVLSQADAGDFFYAGHGLQLLGRNYLVPVAAQGGTLCQNGKWRAFDGGASGTTPYRLFFKDGVFRGSP